MSNGHGQSQKKKLKLELEEKPWVFEFDSQPVIAEADRDELDDHD